MRIAAVTAALLAMAASGPASANTCGGATGDDPISTTTTFNAGALVIPMDTCYNADQGTNTGPTDVAGTCSAASPVLPCYNNYNTSSGNVRHPFGILYLLAENNIPVSIILNQSKNGLADEDFHVTPPTGATSPLTVTYLSESKSYVYSATPAASGVGCGTNTVYYGGMPFVVDSTYAAQAISVIQTFNAANKDEFGDVPLHIINYPFTAPVLGTMQSRPKPVLIDESPLDTFFSESGIPDTTAANTTYLTMTGSFTYTWPTATLGSNGVCTSCSTLSDSSGNNIVDVVWSTNQSGKKDIGNLATWSAMPTFLTNGGTSLNIDSGIAFESGSAGGFGGGLASGSNGDQSGPFCTALAAKHSSGDLVSPGPSAEYPASNRFLQVADMAFVVHGNGGGADGNSTWVFNSSPTAPGVDGLSNGTGYVAIEGHPMISGKQVGGNLIYLGSLSSWHGGSSNKDGGLHIMYNSLLVGAGCAQPSPFAYTELTRSTTIASYSSTSAKVAEYLGTFDWQVPKSGSAMGNQLYQPNPSAYPYTTGHFREYKDAGSFTANSSTDYINCDSSSASSACNWDVATKLGKFSTRNVYVVTGSAGSWTMKTPSALTAADDPTGTISYISTKLDKVVGGSTIGIMGGVDYGTAAIIEGLPSGLVTVANSKSRPTIAYIGSRDGMLHAFCVAGASGGSTCYGKNPGEEIWAIVMPGMLKTMTSAYNNGSNMDWSKVNVGGVIRVADVKDNFEGSTGVYRTVLLVGMHDTGYIDALDISDPDPANLNKAGLSFLWEQDGTTKIDGTTQQPMGKTAGATFSLTGTSNGGAAVLVSSSTCYGMGFSTSSCPTTVTSGENLYLLRMSDGEVVQTDQHLYSRTSLVFGATIPNDVPATPTTLDSDSDGFDETVLAPQLDGYVYKWTLKSGTAPTLATVDTTKTITLFDASGSHCTDSTVACEPIGAPVTIVRNNKSPTLAAYVITGGADWAREPSASNTFHVYAFDATATARATEYTSAALPAITPPVSKAPGSLSGITGVSMALRGFAQPTVSGTDLYTDVTSLSTGTMSDMVQPVITPGTYGTVLRYANANSGNALGTAIYAVTQGANFAGGAGATFTFTSTSGGQELFAADVTGASSQSMQSAPSSSLANSAYAVSNSSGSAGARQFTVKAWFDGSY